LTIFETFWFLVVILVDVHVSIFLLQDVNTTLPLKLCDFRGTIASFIISTANGWTTIAAVQFHIDSFRRIFRQNSFFPYQFTIHFEQNNCAY
jgi:hypothetical protein